MAPVYTDDPDQMNYYFLFTVNIWKKAKLPMLQGDVGICQQ